MRLYEQPVRRRVLRAAGVLGFALSIGWAVEQHWMNYVGYLAAATACWLSARAAVVTTDEGIRIQNSFRSRFVRWSDVEGIVPARPPTLLLRSGQRIRLEGVQPFPMLFPTQGSRATLTDLVHEVEARS